MYYRRVSDEVRAVPADGDSIAIVGMACRYPGGCDDPAGLWQLLERGGSAVRPVPAGRWPETPIATKDAVGRFGGFLDASFPEYFDAAFFDMSPAEARALDPQQRLLLEVGWRALEAAGIVADPEAGRDVGVFVAISTADHQGRGLWHPGAGADSFTATGASFAAAAGRLSYSFGLTGPSLAVDTACSSSLVALHLARQAIRNGECEAALVLGVNALLRPNLFVCLESMNLLAPDGVCRAFDAAASGYVRAEGAGALVLKPLDAARRDANAVLALYRGSAINQDGRTATLTAPSSAAQSRVIARALRDAGLDADDIDYVEAHGTGTPLGDAIELKALTESYAKTRDPATPLLIGSVKTNIGHLEAGAGLAGVIKSVLALEKGVVPGHPHLDAPTPHVDWATVAMRVPSATMDWPARDRPRRAGVSSFGFSGTNAHIILEQAPPAPSRDAAGMAGVVILPLSARTPAALSVMAITLADWLEAAPRTLVDAAFTLGVGRTGFPHRWAVIGDDVAAIVRTLREGATQSRVQSGEDRAPLEGQLRALTLAWEAGDAVDWRRLYQPLGARFVAMPGHPLDPQRHWIDLPGETARAPTVERQPGDGPAGLPDRIDDWRALVRDHARTVLGGSPALDEDVPLQEQGFTSLLGVELRRQLERATGRTLPVGLLYDYPTLARIAGLLAGEARPAATRRAFVAPPAEPDRDFEFLDALSADDLAALIDREVDRL
jgi:acyl transferase domain-containing protein